MSRRDRRRNWRAPAPGDRTPVDRMETPDGRLCLFIPTGRNKSESRKGAWIIGRSETLREWR